MRTLLQLLLPGVVLLLFALPIAHAQGTLDAGSPVLMDAGSGGASAAPTPAALPDPSSSPGETLSLLEKLYKSGALLSLGIVVAFLALRYASVHVAWLQEDHRAVLVAAALGALGLLVVPASQGATPNASMLVAALVTGVSLALNPKKTA